MSNQNQISIVIPDDVITKVTNDLQNIKKLLAPYLQALTVEERKSMMKMGDKTVATVNKVKNYLDTNPEFIPVYMNTEEFKKDAIAVAQLAPIANILEQLHSDVEDTAMLAGSEAVLAAMLYYGTVKEATAKGVTSAKPVYEDLKARFARKSQNKPDNKPSN